MTSSSRRPSATRLGRAAAPPPGAGASRSSRGLARARLARPWAGGRVPGAASRLLVHLAPLLLAACAGTAGPEVEPALEAREWPEADALFRRDPSWVGGDDAHSVALGRGRALWLFADSFVDPTARHDRTSAVLIGNSVAIQEGADPSRAEISFHWRTGDDGSPAAFFADPGADRFWPGHGIRVGTAVVVFLMQVRSTDHGLGFEVHRWRAVRVPDPDLDPSRWTIQEIPVPETRDGIILGSGGVLREGGHVYAFGAQEPGGRHPVFVARWPEERFARGEMIPMEWWAGEAAGWCGDAAPTCRPSPVFADAQTEFTVHRDANTGGFLQFQTVGFGAASIAVRRAAHITGPWSGLRAVYEPPENHLPGILIYAAKAHPHLEGAELVLTYATNTSSFGNLVRSPEIYYPRFVRLERTP